MTIPYTSNLDKNSIPHIVAYRSSSCSLDMIIRRTGGTGNSSGWASSLSVPGCLTSWASAGASRAQRPMTSHSVSSCKSSTLCWTPFLSPHHVFPECLILYQLSEKVSWMHEWIHKYYSMLSLKNEGKWRRK